MKAARAWLHEGAHRACAAAVLALGAALSAHASTIYSCEDSSGRKLTADRPIEACADREQRVLRGTGGERTRLGPSLSEQEAYARQQRALELRSQERQADESQRKERALLQRYPSAAAHEAAHKAAMEHSDARLQDALKRLEALRIERGMQAQEMEFYIRDVTLAPSSLQRLVADTNGVLFEQLNHYKDLQQERKSTVLRFEAERQTLQPYWLKLQADAAAKGEAARSEPATKPSPKAR